VLTDGRKKASHDISPVHSVHLADITRLGEPRPIFSPSLLIAAALHCRIVWTHKLPFPDQKMKPPISEIVGDPSPNGTDGTTKTTSQLIRLNVSFEFMFSLSSSSSSFIIILFAQNIQTIMTSMAIHEQDRQGYKALTATLDVHVS